MVRLTVRVSVQFFTFMLKNHCGAVDIPIDKHEIECFQYAIVLTKLLGCNSC